jgi:hypothetical protein
VTGITGVSHWAVLVNIFDPWLIDAELEGQLWRLSPE